VKIAEVMDFLLGGVLQQSGLKILHEPAKRTPGFSEHLQDGFIVHDLVCSHEKTLAIKTPHHTPTKPSKKLKTTYRAAMKKAPVCKFENVSHSNVENVL
jgi:hypothetical protein